MRNKDALLSALMLRGYARLRACVHVALEDAPDAEPHEQLRVFGNAYVDFATSNAGLYRVLFMTTVRHGVPMPAPDGTEGSDEGVAAFYDLTKIVALVHPEPEDAFARASYMWASIHGYVALRITLSALPLPGSVDYVDLVGGPDLDRLEAGGRERGAELGCGQSAGDAAGPSRHVGFRVGTPQPSDALTAASGACARLASSYSGAPNTPVSSAGLQHAESEPQQPDSDCYACAWLYAPVAAARAACA